MWSIKGKICTIKNMSRINKSRNRLDVLDVIRSFSMTYSLGIVLSKTVPSLCSKTQPCASTVRTKVILDNLC